MIYTKHPPNKIQQTLFLAPCCHHPFVNMVLWTTTEATLNSIGLDIIGFIGENTGVQSYFETTQNVVVIKGFFYPADPIGCLVQAIQRLRLELHYPSFFVDILSLINCCWCHLNYDAYTSNMQLLLCLIFSNSRY